MSKKFEDESRVTLTPEEWERFVEIMDAPVQVNERLKKMFADYNEKYGQEEPPNQ